MHNRQGVEEFFPIKVAFLIALLLHILGIILVATLQAYEILQFDLEPELVFDELLEREEEEIMQFTFVNLPRELPEPQQAPDTEVYSDRDRVAAQESPVRSEVADDSRPYSEGSVDMYTIPEETPPEIVDQTFMEEREAEDLTDSAEMDARAIPEARTVEPENVAEPGEDTFMTDEEAGYFSEEERRQFQESIDESMESYKPSEDWSRYDNQSSSLSSQDSLLSFETKWFDWGPYADQLVRIVRRNWRIPMAAWWPLVMKGRSVIRFTLRKDGTVEELELLDSSGIPSFDDAALYAIKFSDPFPPLPANFPKDKERITFRFYYNIRPGTED